MQEHRDDGARVLENSVQEIWKHWGVNDRKYKVEIKRNKNIDKQRNVQYNQKKENRFNFCI